MSVMPLVLDWIPVACFALAESRGTQWPPPNLPGIVVESPLHPLATGSRSPRHMRDIGVSLPIGLHPLRVYVGSGDSVF